MFVVGVFVVGMDGWMDEWMNGGAVPFGSETMAIWSSRHHDV